MWEWSVEMGFYSVMKDQDYEPVLNQFIEKYSSDYLPSAFDVIMHLKSVTGDLAKTQEWFCQSYFAYEGFINCILINQ